MKRFRSLQLLGLSLVVLGGNAASPPVRITLKSSWPAPSPLIEVLETVALDNPSAFFPLLNRLTNPDLLPLPQKMSPEAVHEASLEIAAVHGFLAEPGSLAAVEMNLALHSATPKIEAFYQHYVNHHNSSRGSECGSWVDWYGEVVCDIETLVQLAGTETIDPAIKSWNDSPFSRPRLLTFDHVYPPPSRTLRHPPRTAIFYASPFSDNFRELHTYLLSLAIQPDPHVEYVFRHIPPKERHAGIRNNLSGYGVALNLKKTDYLAIDDRNTLTNGASKDVALDSDNSELNVDPIITLIHNHPENVTAPDAKTPLSEAELKDIGFQAIQLIADSSTPLDTLTQLSQNFPKYATSLARRVVVNSSLSTEIHANSLKAQGGVRMFWLNGAIVQDKDINPFGLLRLLRKERAAVMSLTQLGLGRGEVLDLLTHPDVTQTATGSATLDGLFDASDRPEDGEVIVWWNDLEKDKRYERWSPSLYALLRAMHHGLPNIRLNLFNVVLVLDLSQVSSLTFITGPMADIIEKNISLRFGVVPITETEEGTRMAKLFFHLVRNYGRKKTLAFLSDLLTAVAQRSEQGVQTIPWDAVRILFPSFVENMASPDDVIASLDDIIAGNVTPEPPLEKAAAYAERLGATLSASSQGHVFLNGKHFKFDDDFFRLMQPELGRQLRYLQEQVYEGKIKEEDNEAMSTYFYNLPTTSLRRNRYIYPESTPGSLRIFNLPQLFSRTGYRVSSTGFIYPSETPVIPLSLYVIADLDSETGLGLVKEALSSITPDSHTRITFIHNPSIDPDEANPLPAASWLLAHLITSHSLAQASPAQLLRALGLDEPVPAKDGPQAVLSSKEDIWHALTGGVKVADFDTNRYANYVRASRLVARDVGIAPGELGLMVNGRVVGPIDAGEFRAADFGALEAYEIRQRAEPVMKGLEAVDPSLTQLDRETYAQLVSMAASVISSIQLPDPSETGLFDAPQRPRSKQYQLLDSEYTVFEAGDNITALYHIAVLMDPLSVTAQKWSSLLQWLSNIPDTFIQVHLNPARHSEIPLKSFYRYNLIPSLSFDENGLEIPSQAIFKDLPIEPIYTLAMDIPSSWLVRPQEALYDLDNIQLGSLSPQDHSVDAIFSLDYLVVEGHAREVPAGNPPRGVQLELTQGEGTPIDDTQVVANLGYLQFKATPGVFGLGIRRGRGREIFKMQSVGNEGWDSPTVEEGGSEITLTSFEGLTLYPRLVRLPGMESADVLEEPKPESGGLGGIFGGFKDKVTSLFKPKETSVARTEEQAEINIFTVASGLLYERFASIMILSVLRNTKSTVKFWFIENFLSPSFLEFIPHLAEKYHFQYELVTYKWPSWLREQTEKQRIIWAYKILFLDVLFPMDLKKVIFVDADQIVRADLKELVDLDLQGAPYGYTPMGDDNTDMEGFRFWKTGYWKEFLQGRPYHISALYVVDLVRFRQLAAGDILRGQYQQLSADPNSLANLDQDLPNNLQREVPIFSLNEDWLWCETWCSKDRLHRAKTIDLCQNPLTKEPKLARARQIPEWEEYDAEIARFARELAEAGLIHSGLAVADANVLANAGATASEGTKDEPAQEPEATADDESTLPKDEQPRDEL
ncbi:UDP-glucose:glycoprotein glucosyltransferase [Hypsizygus marmoreus]|uniref:UDP-glucose:glycoprotein glucosyltransferase n=1 Tax=Hypsizygus marmoreus TaxID=39966 RepID=A0A369JXM0_HYPMA|nr:UDP-glucose:glycoprotein glucosyltransferase [Hypsizygus marmoreus]